MKNRKSNRLKGYDYSKNNLYFVTNCVKNNLCCLGRVISGGTGRDLSENHHSKNHHSINHHREKNGSNFQDSDLNYYVELNQYGLIVVEKIIWLMNQYPYVDIHNYIVMPNHFHLILEIDNAKCSTESLKIKSLSSLIGALKTTSSKEIHLKDFDTFEWHRSFHDHIIKDEKAYNNIFNYITNNPSNWRKDSFYHKV
jgi:REP element-mobilizing transposase RayT